VKNAVILYKIRLVMPNALFVRCQETTK